MNYEEWKAKIDEDDTKKPKRYAHFDNRVRFRDVESYVTNPKKVETHIFYPFIRYEKESIKFDGTQFDRKKPKIRPIAYSSHKDRRIYQYYGYLLNQKYNARVKRDDIDHVSIAYRDNSHKCNIDFAYDAIKYIRDLKKCFIMIGDFSDFFDRLDHEFLKLRICNLLGCGEKLPKDFMLCSRISHNTRTGR